MSDPHRQITLLRELLMIQEQMLDLTTLADETQHQAFIERAFATINAIIVEFGGVFEDSFDYAVNGRRVHVSYRVQAKDESAFDGDDTRNDWKRL